MFSLKGGADLVKLARTFDDLAKLLDEDVFSQVSHEGMKSATQTLENAIKLEFDSSVPDDSPTVYNQERGMTRESISNMAYEGKVFPGAYGHAGYYALDAVAFAHGRGEKGTENSSGRVRADSYRAPLLGYWLEFGTSPHSLSKGSRTARRDTGKSRARAAKGDATTIHPGTPALNILTKAMARANADMYREITAQLGDHVKKAFK